MVGESECLLNQMEIKLTQSQMKLQLTWNWLEAELGIIPKRVKLALVVAQYKVRGIFDKSSSSFEVVMK